MHREAGIRRSAATPSNDKIERHHFEQFCKVYALIDGSVAYGDKPDVIVHGTRKIGIEIRNFFIQSGKLPVSKQQQKPLRDKVVSDAHKLYLADGGKSVELTFVFDKNNPIVPARMKALSRDLAGFAQSHHDQSSDKFYQHRFRDTMPELWSIHFNAEEYSRAKWHIMPANEVAPMSKDDLEAIVREKESKTAQCQPCDAYWLLVVVDGIDAAQEQEIRIDNLEVGSSVFEKIIIFHTFGHFEEIATAA